MMKRIVFWAVAALAVCACGEKITPEPEDPIVTSEVTEITMDSATLYGSVATEHLVKGGEFGFIVSDAPTPTLENGKKVVASGADKKGRYNAEVSGLSYATTYYYKAFLNFGTTSYEGAVKQFTTKDFSLAAVDLGLSVKWANANLGADSPEGYGDYFAWGETEPKEAYSWWTYKWSDGSEKAITKYNTAAATELEAADDAARARLGGKWRMPTAAELEELIATWKNDDGHYRWELITEKGHRGWRLTYLVNNKSIFFPAAGQFVGESASDEGDWGHYWTSSRDANSTAYAKGLNFSNGLSVRTATFYRYLGFPIRPVWVP